MSVAFTKLFWYFDILTWSSIFNLESLSLLPTPYSRYWPSYTSEGFIFIDLWYVLMHLPLFYLAYQYKYFLIPHSYASRSNSSKFWKIFQQEQTFLRCMLKVFQFHYNAILTSLICCKTRCPGLTMPCLV